MSQTAKREMLDRDEDMHPEYDFSKGLRGVHAHRFSKLPSDEAFVLGYWQGQGFEVASYSKQEMRDGKTPDFRLSRGGKEVALCEVKSFQRDAWLEDQLKKAAPGELVGGLRPDPTFNRISNAVHTAFKQFEGVNPDHRLLNILFLVNHDTGAGNDASVSYKDLIRTLTGFEDPLNGRFDLTCAQFSEGRISREKGRIDVYLWMDVTKQGSLGKVRYLFGNPDSRQMACDLLRLDPARIVEIPPAA
jgi:hypothetical protein